MRKIAKVLMVLLSYSPIATVAVAAQAKANEIEGEDQNVKLIKSLQQARNRILPDGFMVSSIEDSKRRYGQLTGLDGQALTDNMKNDIELLLNNGLIQLNEKEILAHGPSQLVFQ